ncbi:MAG: heavy metal-binding domain-containing protein [Solirubrobacteraceae bacterium]
MSPLFRRSRAEADPEAERRAEESISRLQAGGLPLAAEERLRQLASAEGKPGLFSSDLSVQEFALLAGLGVQPLTQVMGSSIYQVGWQPIYFNVPTEVTVLSEAYNESRRLALGRLLEEASLAAADAVVGVRIVSGAHDWAARAIEFIAVGTAVRLAPPMRHPDGAAVLTDLTGQEFVQLCRAGVRPVGIAAHTSVHYVPASWQTQRATSGGWGGAAWINQELGDFTQGVYAAREKAIGATTAQAEQLGADGIVGVQISERARTHRVTRGAYECEDLEVTFHVMGTAIREDPALATSHTQAEPLTVLPLR